MIHHHTVPKLCIITTEPRMCGNLDPIIPYHIFQGLVTYQGSKASLQSEIFYVVNFEIVHSECLKCQVLLFYLGEFFIYLV